MKIIKLFLLIGFVSAFLLSYSIGRDKVNYKVTGVMKLEKAVFIKQATAPPGPYIVNCPGGGVGCGNSYGLYCQLGMKDCAPTFPPPSYKTFTCPSNPGFYACILAGGPNPSCSTPVSCPNLELPTKHMAVCRYGSPTYGCFSGWVYGSPFCTELVNCNDYPD